MTKEEIGITLKQLRLKSGMTQKEVAEKLGRKQQIVGHWETGYSQPDANTLFTLCELYGTTVDEAFGFIRKSTAISSSEYGHIKKYRILDEHGKDIVDMVLAKEYERCQELRLDMVPKISPQKEERPYLLPDAAHTRTDIPTEEHTDELKRLEDAIMDNENF